MFLALLKMKKIISILVDKQGVGFESVLNKKRSYKVCSSYCKVFCK